MIWSYDIIYTFSGCGVTYYNSHGTIASENYPSKYPHNSNCEYFIHVGANKNIIITFLSFATESGYDYLTFFDYINGEYEEAKKWSGDSLPSPFTSKSNRMRILFTSDGSNHDEGFQFKFTENDIPEPSGMYTIDIFFSVILKILKWYLVACLFSLQALNDTCMSYISNKRLIYNRY